MDTQIAAWEMNLESDPPSLIREEIANWPSEPFTINWDEMSWN